MKWMEGKMRKEVWIVSSEHKGVNSEWEREDGNCEDTEAETDNRNGEQRLVMLNKG
jgi:hypothetical protein